MKRQAYEDHCPDCLPLPDTFPMGCVGVVLDALKGNVTDVKCTVHCCITLAAWGAGLWIGDEPHPIGAAATGDEKAAAIAELEKIQAAAPKSGVKSVMAVGAFNWKIVLAMVLKLLEGLLK